MYSLKVQWIILKYFAYLKVYQKFRFKVKLQHLFSLLIRELSVNCDALCNYAFEFSI